MLTVNTKEIKKAQQVIRQETLYTIKGEFIAQDTLEFRIPNSFEYVTELYLILEKPQDIKSIRRVGLTNIDEIVCVWDDVVLQCLQVEPLKIKLSEYCMSHDRPHKSKNNTCLRMCFKQYEQVHPRVLLQVQTMNDTEKSQDSGPRIALKSFDYYSYDSLVQKFTSKVGLQEDVYWILFKVFTSDALDSVQLSTLHKIQASDILVKPESPIYDMANRFKTCQAFSDSVYGISYCDSILAPTSGISVQEMVSSLNLTFKSTSRVLVLACVSASLNKKNDYELGIKENTFHDSFVGLPCQQQPSQQQPLPYQHVPFTRAVYLPPAQKDLESTSDKNELDISLFQRIRDNDLLIQNMERELSMESLTRQFLRQQIKEDTEKQLVLATSCSHINK
jgi:hypothetical protein